MKPRNASGGVSIAGPVVRLRQITDSDVPAIARLLHEGFPDRAEGYWLRGLGRMKSRASRPNGYPVYGYLLENKGAPVGAILLFFSSLPSDSAAVICCNVSSWYVRSEYRVYASLLVSSVTKDKAVTFFNVSALPHTWPTLIAQGFSVYCRGQMYAFPILRRPVGGASIEAFDDSSSRLDHVSDHEILRQCSVVGNLSLIVRCDGESHPFVFQKHYAKSIFPLYRLAYCRKIDDFVRFSGNLGRFLLKQGVVCVQLDANERMSSLVGFYTERRGRKFAKGTHPPRLGDLSLTEAAFFGS
jgi:hypothetical protein